MYVCFMRPLVNTSNNHMLNTIYHTSKPYKTRHTGHIEKRNQCVPPTVIISFGYLGIELAFAFPLLPLVARPFSLSLKPHLYTAICISKPCCPLFFNHSYHLSSVYCALANFITKLLWQFYHLINSNCIQKVLVLKRMNSAIISTNIITILVPIIILCKANRNNSESKWNFIS